MAVIIDTIIEICALPVALTTDSIVHGLLILYRWTQERWAEKYSLKMLWASHVSIIIIVIAQFYLLLEPCIATQWAIEPFTPIQINVKIS